MDLRSNTFRDGKTNQPVPSAQVEDAICSENPQKLIFVRAPLDIASCMLAIMTLLCVHVCVQMDWEIEQIAHVLKPLAALTMDPKNHPKLIANFPNLLRHFVDPKEGLISLRLVENFNRGCVLSLSDPMHGGRL